MGTDKGIEDGFDPHFEGFALLFVADADPHLHCLPSTDDRGTVGLDGKIEAGSPALRVTVITVVRIGIVALLSLYLLYDPIAAAGIAAGTGATISTLLVPVITLLLAIDSPIPTGHATTLGGAGSIRFTVVRALVTCLAICILPTTYLGISRTSEGEMQERPAAGADTQHTILIRPTGLRAIVRTAGTIVAGFIIIGSRTAILSILLHDSIATEFAEARVGTAIKGDRPHLSTSSSTIRDIC